MLKPMKVDFDVLHEVGRMTGNRRPDEVVSDALRTYLWILHQQTFGCTIASTENGYRQPLANLVEDRKAAQAYFDGLGW